VTFGVENIMKIAVCSTCFENIACTPLLEHLAGYRKFRKNPADEPWDVARRFYSIYKVVKARGK